jgi:acylphosphatase
MAMQLKRVRMIAAGRVQGVFFRDSLRQEAERLGLTGWARNRPDGRAEAELQGPGSAVEEAVDFCRRGPGSAEVEWLEVEQVPYVEGENRFTVN